jgi:hypothetical protein
LCDACLLLPKCYDEKFKYGNENYFRAAVKINMLLVVVFILGWLEQKPFN